MDNEVWRWVWTGMALIMAVGEIITAGFFLLPFAIGAGLAAVAAWIGLTDVVQWALFFIGTAVSMLYVRRFIRVQDQEQSLVVGPKRYVGGTGLVIETIDTDLNTGLIRIEAEEWRAITDGGPIPEGTRIKVVELRGTRLVVERSTKET
ncbi:MAG: NfeD family protein [Acidimicrobiia bacterium]|nr:NfeD family protein [Acidimicrobiia bacterium]MYH55520.1 NfeD family protein [Acidimicrobiia bacterium]